jgi:hypothetical protein
MARQPYLPNFAKLNYSIGALVIKERPDLCAGIGKCVAIWSQVDNEMGNLFSLMLGTESDAALEVFLSLRKSHNQFEALQLAAKYSLADEKFLCFEAMMMIYKGLETDRNCLAHGCFGICPEEPTVLFWIAVKDHVHFQVESLSKESRGEFSEDRHAKLKEKLYVYRLSDLDALYNKMEEFWWTIFYFNGYLREPNNTGRIEEFRRILASPQIKQATSSVKK